MKNGIETACNTLQQDTASQFCADCVKMPVYQRFSRNATQQNEPKHNDTKNSIDYLKKWTVIFEKACNHAVFACFSGFLLCSNTAKNQQKINRLSKINSPTDWTGYIFRLIGEAVLMWKYMCMCCVYLQYQQYQKTKRIIYNLVYVICSSFRDYFLSSIWYTSQVPL